MPGWCFCIICPNLLLVFQSLSQARYQHVDWDTANFWTWDYMLHAGLRPLRDFWYPYSGAYVQLLPFPTGVIAATVHRTAVLWVLYWSLFKVTGRRLAQALAIFGLIVTPVLLDMLPGWSRYLVAVDVALLYVAVCGTCRPRLEDASAFRRVYGLCVFL